MKRCAFAGHRTASFPWKDDEHAEGCLKLKEALNREIDKAVEDGYTYFIYGGAEGVDTWAAEYIIELKKENPQIRLELAKPYASYNSQIRGEIGKRIRDAEEASDKVTYISDGSDDRTDCFMRDCYMVDSSDRIVIVYDDESTGSSGTKDTLLYAKASGIEVRQIQWKHL